MHQTDVHLHVQELELHIIAFHTTWPLSIASDNNPLTSSRVSFSVGQLLIETIRSPTWIRPHLKHRDVIIRGLLDLNRSDGAEDYD